jgi:hypothetical protein
MFLFHATEILDDTLYISIEALAPVEDSISAKSFFG